MHLREHDLRCKVGPMLLLQTSLRVHFKSISRGSFSNSSQASGMRSICHVLHEGVAQCLAVPDMLGLHKIFQGGSSERKHRSPEPRITRSHEFEVGALDVTIEGQHFGTQANGNMVA